MSGRRYTVDIGDAGPTASRESILVRYACSHGAESDLKISARVNSDGVVKFWLPGTIIPIVVLPGEGLEIVGAIREIHWEHR